MGNPQLSGCNVRRTGQLMSDVYDSLSILCRCGRFDAGLSGRIILGRESGGGRPKVALFNNAANGIG